jgi:hypothetical protein
MNFSSADRQVDALENFLALNGGVQIFDLN